MQLYRTVTTRQTNQHRRRQPYSRGSRCCPIICTGPAPNVKCCPIFGIELNINGQKIINYKWFILTNHAAQSARSSCTHSDTLDSIQVIPGRRLRESWSSGHSGQRLPGTGWPEWNAVQIARIGLHFGDDIDEAKLTRQLPLLQDICQGSDIKTVHDLISVLTRDTTRTTCALLDQVRLWDCWWCCHHPHAQQSGHFHSSDASRHTCGQQWLRSV